MRQLPPIEGCAECGMARAGSCPFHETRLAAGSVLVAQGEKPDRVIILDRMDVPGAFRRADRRLDAEQVETVYAAARRSTTWT